MEQDLEVQMDRRRFGVKGQSLDLGDPWKREGQSLGDPIKEARV